MDLRELCVVVPAYEAEASLPAVLAGLAAELPSVPVVVVDDGSRDATARIAAAAGASVVRHPQNRGKGAALVTGFREALARGREVALTVDADGQHPAGSARTIAEASDDRDAWVLAVRDLVAERAPRANRFSNAISNHFVSSFAGRPLADTQCGLRRYPIRATLALGARSTGYAFEAEALLLAAYAGGTIVERVVPIVYPPEHERKTHFHKARDPMRIIATIAGALPRREEVRREGLRKIGAT